MILTTEYLAKKGFNQLKGTNIWLYKIVESVNENLSITAYHDDEDNIFRMSLDVERDGIDFIERENGSFPLRSITTVEELETIFSFLPKRERKLKPLFEALNPNI